MGLHVVRGLLLLTTSFLAFMSLRHMPVGEFTAIILVTPMVVTLLAARMLREHVTLVRKLFVMGGFIGTLTIIRPGGQDFNWTLLYPLGCVAANAGFQLLTSRMARTESSSTMQFYTGWIGALLPAFALPWFWVDIHDSALWAGLLLMGVMATVGHYLFILAFKRAPVATLMPYTYAQIAFSLLGGWLLFSHVPDGWSLVGMSLIAMCGTAGAWLSAHEAHMATDSKSCA
jgi:drug/metabolite transporter (DMT)-like permease